MSTKLTRDDIIRKYQDELFGMLCAVRFDQVSVTDLGWRMKTNLVRIRQLLGEAYDDATGTSLGQPNGAPKQPPPNPAPPPIAPSPSQQPRR